MTTMTSRRSLLAGGAALLAMPAIGRAATVLRPLDFGAVPMSTAFDPQTRINNALALQAMCDAATFTGQDVDMEGGPFVVTRQPGKPYAFCDTIGLRWHFGGGGYSQPQLCYDGGFLDGQCVMMARPDRARIGRASVRGFLVENFTCMTWDDVGHQVGPTWQYTPATLATNLYAGDCLQIQIPAAMGGFDHAVLDGGFTNPAAGWSLNIIGDPAGASWNHGIVRNWDAFGGIRMIDGGDSNLFQQNTAWGMQLATQPGASVNVVDGYGSGSLTRPAFECPVSSHLVLRALNIEQQGYRGTKPSAAVNLLMPGAPGRMGHFSLQDVSVGSNGMTELLGSLVALGNMHSVSIERLSLYAGAGGVLYGLNCASVGFLNVRDQITVSGNIINPTYVDPAAGTTVVGDLTPRTSSN